jgi:hypothetical protein
MTKPRCNRSCRARRRKTINQSPHAKRTQRKLGEGEETSKRLRTDRESKSTGSFDALYRRLPSLLSRTGESMRKSARWERAATASIEKYDGIRLVERFPTLQFPVRITPLVSSERSPLRRNCAESRLNGIKNERSAINNEFSHCPDCFRSSSIRAICRIACLPPARGNVRKARSSRL